MKSIWLNKCENKNLIVFYSGWGVSEKSFCSLDFGNFDVLFVNSYENFSLCLPDFSIYSQKYLIAWSFGVLASTEDRNKYDKRIAINGTYVPYSNEFGIQKKIYDLMIQGLSQTSLEKFKNKTDDKNIVMNTDLTLLLSELETVKNYIPTQKMSFDKVIISSQDKIIPYKNQINFWKKEGAAITILHLGHSIFHKFNSWGEIIDVR